MGNGIGVDVTVVIGVGVAFCDDVARMCVVTDRYVVYVGVVISVGVGVVAGVAGVEFGAGVGDRIDVVAGSTCGGVGSIRIDVCEVVVGCGIAACSGEVDVSTEDDVHGVVVCVGVDIGV